MARSHRPLVDLNGLDDLQAEYEALGKYAFADALQDGVVEMVEVAQAAMKPLFEKAIQGGPARFTEIDPGSPSSSVLVSGGVGATKGVASASVYVQEMQSAYLKFQLGEEADRTPGDTGIATSANFVPIKENLALVGIELDRHGNLTDKALDLLTQMRKRGKVKHGLRRTKGTRDVDATRKDRSQGVGTKETVFYGVPKTKRGKILPEGFWFRPADKKAKLKLLVAALPVSHYGDKPHLIPAWNEAVEGAGKEAGGILRRALEERLDALRAGRKTARQNKNAAKRARSASARAAREARGERVHPGQSRSSARARGEI